MRHGPSIGAAVMGVAGASSGTRGAERSAGVTHALFDAGPGFALRGADRDLWAKLGEATSVASNRWRYTWEEVHLDPLADGLFAVTIGGRTSASHGHAYNTIEAFNDGAGVEGTGVDQANLPSGIVMRPIGAGAVVSLRLMPSPASASGTFGLFTAINAYDGQCPQTAASVREASGALLDAILLGEDGEDEANPLVGSDGLWLLGAEAEGLPSADLDDLAQVLCDGETAWWLLDAEDELMTSRDLGAPVRNLLDRLLLDASGIPIGSNDGSILLTE